MEPQNQLPGYEIRNMTRRDVDLAIAWAAEEGWNPGLEDAAAFYSADPFGYFIGELDGEPISVVSAVNYNDSFSFVGLYIVKPEHRGKGYGLSIFRHAMEYAGGRNLGGDGVIEQLDNYATLGLHVAYRNTRYQAPAKSLKGLGEISCNTDWSIVPAWSVSLEQVVNFDAKHFPSKRHAFLANWLNQSGATALAAKDADENILGYGMIRPCHAGWKIGPLFADNPEIAEDIFHMLTASADDGPVYLDTPQPNAQAVALAERHGMEPVFETGRFYSQTPPDLDLNKVFGVTSFELG